MKRLALFLFGLLSAIQGWSQAAAISGQVINQYGSPVAGAQVYVCSAATSSGTPCTPVATIYSDYNLGSPIANPTQTDANGNFNFYVGALAAPNIYVVQATPDDGQNFYTWIFNGPYCSVSGCTFTGTVTAPIFNATNQFQVNGVQIACANLSDCANLAKINAANTFTGSPQTAPIFNATTQFNVNGSQIAASNLANGTTGTGLIVLQTSPTLVTPNIGVAGGTSLNLSGALQAASESITGTSQANIFNAVTGFRIGGAAPNNHILVGNGTNYVDSATIPAGALPTLYYQTVEANGTGQTQRSALNFSANFALSDSASPSRTTVELSSTGISSGACNNPSSITYDVFGRASNCTSGGGTTPVAKTCNSNGCYRIEADGTIEQWGVSTVVSSPTSAASLTITYPTSFTSTGHLRIVTSAESDATGDGNPHAADCHIVLSSLTTSGATAVIAAVVQIGGSGYANLAAGDFCSWHAFGD